MRSLLHGSSRFRVSKKKTKKWAKQNGSQLWFEFLHHKIGALFIFFFLFQIEHWIHLKKPYPKMKRKRNLRNKSLKFNFMISNYDWLVLEQSNEVSISSPTSNKVTQKKMDQICWNIFHFICFCKKCVKITLSNFWQMI